METIKENKKINKIKPETIKSLQKKLDRIFSEFIRRRDSDSDGYIRCISCGKLVHWKESDAGHFVNRAIMSLRYDEKNVNAQCRHCNRFREGNFINYEIGLLRKYGRGIIEYFNIKKYNIMKMSITAYQALIEEYKLKLTNLKKKNEHKQRTTDC